MENGGLRPSYDRIDEQEPGLGITIGAKSTNHQMTRKMCTDHNINRNIGGFYTMTHGLLLEGNRNEKYGPI